MRRRFSLAAKCLRTLCCVPFASALVVGRFRARSCSNERLCWFLKKTSQIAAAWSKLVLQIRKNLWLHRNHDFPYGSARIDVCGLLGLRNGKSGPPAVTIRTAFGCLRDAQTQFRATGDPHCTVTATGAEGMPLATTTS